MIFNLHMLAAQCSPPERNYFKKPEITYAKFEFKYANLLNHSSSKNIIPQILGAFYILSL